MSGASNRGSRRLFAVMVDGGAADGPRDDGTDDRGDASGDGPPHSRESGGGSDEQ
jgi:hypothetical protein